MSRLLNLRVVDSVHLDAFGHFTTCADCVQRVDVELDYDEQETHHVLTVTPVDGERVGDLYRCNECIGKRAKL